MSYIDLINNFWKVDVEYSFTGNEAKLYFFLIHTSNSLGWRDTIRLSYRQISLGANLGVNTIKSARNKLEQAGLISWKEGKSGYSGDINNKTQYTLRLPERQSNLDGHKGGQSYYQSGDQSGGQSYYQSDTVNRQDKIRQDIIIPPIIPQGDDSLEKEFDKFRRSYPGNKGGLSTEFGKFKKKHKDWKDVVPLLLPALEKEIAWRGYKKERKEWTPEYKNLSTWLNNRCWEQEFEKEHQSIGVDTSRIALGIGVWIDGGKKFYGSREHPREIPLNAPYRPSQDAKWDATNERWTISGG